jgi:hypothetical protein
MKNHADEMIASGQSLGDEDFVVYILTGLDKELYNSLVSTIITCVEPISPSELFSQMLSYELHLEKQEGGLLLAIFNKCCYKRVWQLQQQWSRLWQVPRLWPGLRSPPFPWQLQ